MISDIEDYFGMGCGRCKRFGTDACSTRTWQRGLAKLRAICLSADLREVVKWGHPCYMYANRNVVIIGALQGDFRLSFFHAALMSDPQGVLERQGPNTKYPDMIRFTSNDDPDVMEDVIRSYLNEAKDYAEAGKKPPTDDGDLDLPDELVVALDADPELAEGFLALTRGRQKSYVILLNGAKRTETRTARIARFRDKILAGKGANER